MVSNIMLMLASQAAPQINQPSESSQSADRYRDMMKEMMKSAKSEKQEKTEKKESGNSCAEEVSDECCKDGKPADNDAAMLVPEDMGLQSFIWIQQPAAAVSGEAAGGEQQDMAIAAEGNGNLVLDEEEAPLEEIPVEKAKTENSGNVRIPFPQEDSSVNTGETKAAPAAINNVAPKLEKAPVSGKEESVDKKIRQVLPDTSRPAEPQQVEPSAELVHQTSAAVVENNVLLQETGGKTEVMPESVSAEETEKIFQKLPEDLFVRISAGEKEFSVQLEPESLGKLMIKASYDQGKATISIICTNEKTLQFLSGRAGELGSIMENSLGTPTNIVLDKAPQDYLNQGQNGQNGHQNEPDNAGKEKKEQHKKNDGQNFLQQLRLGLV